VRALIKEGVDVNGTDAGQACPNRDRPLALAAAGGHLPVVALLLSAGADPSGLA
jgi:hypothetical protein